MLPIYRELKKDPNIEIGICSPFDQYIRDVRVGFKEEESSILPTDEVTVVKTPQEFNSDVVFIADAVTYMVQDCGKIINVGHGLLSKGQYFTDSDYISRENLEHLLLVPGEFHKQAIRESGLVYIPVEAVGYPKIDDLFKPNAKSRDELCRQAGLDPTRKIILYAPTFNIALSTIPIIWTRIKELSDPNTYLLIKFHGSTLPEFVDAHETMTQENPNIRLVADLDITPYLQIADVMVSDVSSAYIEFALLDKPVVLFNNPNLKEYMNYDPRDIEYAWRDIGIQVTSLEGMKKAVVRSLEHPEELSEKRQYYRDKLGVKCDGKASQRAVEMMWELLDGRIEKRLLHPPENISVALTGNVNDSQSVIRTVNDISSVGGINADIYLLSPEITPDIRSSISAVTGNNLKFLSSPEEIDALNRSTYICLLPVGTVGWDRWLFRMVNHLRRDKDLQAVVPLTPEGNPVQHPGNYLDPIDGIMPAVNITDSKFKAALTARNLKPNQPLRPDAGMVRTGTAASGKMLEFLSGNDTNPFDEAMIALDVVLNLPKFQRPVVMQPGYSGVCRTIVDNNSGNLLSQTERRINELAAKIGSAVGDETERERQRRLEAENHLKAARHLAGKGMRNGAVNAATKAISAYPGCIAAKQLIEQMKQQNAVEIH